MEHPPLFDRMNYAYWRVRMRSFINTLDEKAWKSVLSGWSPPTKRDDEGKIVHKPELEWLSKEDKLANNNRKALNAIFNGVDLNQLKLIFTMESTKKAWDILQVTYEGTNTVWVATFDN